MRSPASYDALETLGRVRLGQHFFMRDFLYSEISNFHAIPNIPDDPDRTRPSVSRASYEAGRRITGGFPAG